MTAILILLAILAIAFLASRLGADSRGLGDNTWRRDGLWSREDRRQPHGHA